MVDDECGLGVLFQAQSATVVDALSKRVLLLNPVLNCLWLDAKVLGSKHRVVESVGGYPVEDLVFELDGIGVFTHYGVDHSRQRLLQSVWILFWRRMFIALKFNSVV